MARQCPACATRNAVNAAFCSTCGASLTGEPPPPPAPAPQQVAATPPPAYAPPPPPQYAQQPPPGYYPPPVIVQKKRHGCLWASLITVGVLIVIGVTVGVVTSKKHSDDVAAAQKSCAGLTYPDKQNLDHCANAAAQVENFGFTVTAMNFHRGDAVFGPEICADVSYLNRASGSSSFNVFDWKLQTPSGVVQSFELTDATLHSGALVAGGTVSGSVCFKDNGETGQFVLIWKPELRSDRGIWVFTL